MPRSRVRPPSRRFRRAAACVLLAAFGVTACSDDEPSESPAPGGTSDQLDGSIVRAPNGTNMGAPPINAGTPAP